MYQKQDAKLIDDILHASVSFAKNNAIVIEDESFSYEELFQKVGGIYTIVTKLKNDVIGIMAENNVETYATILAVLIAGKTYVIMHPSYPEKRNTHIARQAGITNVLHSQSLSPNPVEGIEWICVSNLSNQLPEILPNKISSETNAYIIFTSGSTGEPKGVPISHNNLNAFYNAYSKLNWKLDETDRMLQMFELTFDVSVVSFLYPLTLGACIYTVPSDGIKYLDVLSIIDEHKLTFAAVAPSVLRLAQPYFKEIELPSLKYLIVTAEASDVNLLSDFRFCAPNASFVNLYGPTEGTIYCSSYLLPKDNCKHHNSMAAIGKPFEGIDAIIADEEGNQLASGEIGELWISGPQIMSGYWNDPEKSMACFALGKDKKTYYKTGDLCWQDEDEDIIYCGRKDTQIKIQGFRVELSEIEHQAKSFYENKANAVVIPTYEENNNCELHLVIEQPNSDMKALEQYLKERLPPYMLPKRIHFMTAFPLNTNNKVDKKEIKSFITNN